ncbi:hypothetical protein KDAU_38780 [Dictyobacter aurantiacus]|uniref:Uncharacterized protein n=1 Tax=Dictyobacter aurantiacus TaxID=1936993 RepID=A0A401ZI76_9CHLR|nr:hypothetical protein KDAU_38780 [Dictyobacter aurantiacus]
MQQGRFGAPVALTHKTSAAAQRTPVRGGTMRPDKMRVRSSVRGEGCGTACILGGRGHTAKKYYKQKT